MRQIKKSFESKLDLYYSGARGVKMGRKDKYELKEKIGFKLEVNPVLRMFQIMNDRLVRPVLCEAMEEIVEHSSLLKKFK